MQEKIGVRHRHRDRTRWISTTEAQRRKELQVLLHWRDGSIAWGRVVPTQYGVAQAKGDWCFSLSSSTSFCGNGGIPSRGCQDGLVQLQSNRSRPNRTDKSIGGDEAPQIRKEISCTRFTRWVRKLPIKRHVGRGCPHPHPNGVFTRRLTGRGSPLPSLGECLSGEPLWRVKWCSWERLGDREVILLCECSTT
jgi:hypothetical protein